MVVSCGLRFLLICLDLAVFYIICVPLGLGSSLFFCIRGERGITLFEPAVSAARVMEVHRARELRYGGDEESRGGSMMLICTWLALATGASIDGSLLMMIHNFLTHYSVLQ